jgi:plasmid stabilization system protein ParE
VDHEVILTEPARDDLREIVAFIAQDNPQAAVAFRDRLIAEAETLVRFLIEAGSCGAGEMFVSSFADPI